MHLLHHLIESLRKWMAQDQYGLAKITLAQGSQDLYKQLPNVEQVIRAVHTQDEYHNFEKYDEKDRDPVADPEV